MAPKRSAGRGKAGEAAGDEADVQGWKSSKCSDSHLLGLVESHLLQPWNIIHWRRSDGESFPHEEGNESVVFLWQNQLNYPSSSALAITIRATPTQMHFKRNNSWSVG